MYVCTFEVLFTKILDFSTSEVFVSASVCFFLSQSHSSASVLTRKPFIVWHMCYLVRTRMNFATLVSFQAVRGPVEFRGPTCTENARHEMSVYDKILDCEQSSLLQHSLACERDVRA